MHPISSDATPQGMNSKADKKIINLASLAPAQNEKDKPVQHKSIRLPSDSLYPPPMDVYKPRVSTQQHDCLYYGLNMYFKKPHRFSEDPTQGGGDFAAN